MLWLMMSSPLSVFFLVLRRIRLQGKRTWISLEKCPKKFWQNNVEGMIVTSLKMSTCSRSYRPLTNATQHITEYIDLNPTNESSFLFTFWQIQSIILFTWGCLLHRTGRSGDLRALPATKALNYDFRSRSISNRPRETKSKKKMRIDLDITQGGSADRGTSSIARFRLSWHNLGVKLPLSSLKHVSAR